MNPPYSAQDTGCQRHVVTEAQCVFVCIFAGLSACVKVLTHHNQPEGIIKVLPCLSSILWQSWHLSPRKISPCFPDKTQFSYISRFWCVGGISQKTCSVTGKIYCVYTVRLTCTHIYFFSDSITGKKSFHLTTSKKVSAVPPHTYLMVADWTSYLSLHTNWPFLLGGCDTRLKCLRSQCGNRWSSPARS